MRSVAVLLVLLISGCDSNPTTGEELFSATGEGGSASAKDGSASIQGSSASVDDKNPVADDVELCDCPPYHGCRNGKCERMPYLYVSLRTRTSELTTRICAYRDSVDPTEVFATAGSCSVEGQINREAELAPMGTGAIRVRDPEHTIAEIEEPDDYGSCFPDNALGEALGDVIDFSEGEVLTIASAGGDRFPPFQVDIAVPEELVKVELPTSITPGEPLAASWQAGLSEEVSLAVVGGYRTIVCRDLPDSGSYTIPAELTALLADEALADITLARASSLHFTPAGSNVGIDVKVETSQVWRETPITP